MINFEVVKDVVRAGRGEVPTGTDNILRPGRLARIPIHPEGATIMAKHLNPLEKELLIRRFKVNPRIKINDFCMANDVSESAFRKWLRQYESEGIEGLARSDHEFKDVLPDGAAKTMEGYKREILKLRIENERLKKSYAVRRKEDGELEYIHLKPKSLQ